MDCEPHSSCRSAVPGAKPSMTARCILQASACGQKRAALSGCCCLGAQLTSYHWSLRRSQKHSRSPFWEKILQFSYTFFLAENFLQADRTGQDA